MPTLDPEIDRLYQLPLGEFTAARNTLAKSAGKDGAGIRQLTKPPVAAWAVNQVHWRHPEVYDSLVRAAEAMRVAHAAILSGKKADLRSTGREHEEAVDAALKAALGVLADEGQPATEATRQAIATTLRALPAGEPPGRLARTLQPGGFEMLTGIPVSAKPPGRKAPARTTVGPGSAQTIDRKPPTGKPAGSAKAVARAREALASATRSLRTAEQAARREEFEAARTARDAEKAARSVQAARETLEEAKQAVAEAEREAAAAERQRGAAARRAERAEEALNAARQKSDAAQRALDELL